MSKIFYTSDLHWGHKNIIKYCLRGYGTRDQRLNELTRFGGDYEMWLQNSKFAFKSTNDMNRYLIERWNSVVDVDDIVYVLGDFGMGDRKAWKTYFEQLNGSEKHLILGNHDCKNANKTPDSKQWVPHNEILECGFTSISEELYLNDGGRTVWMAHIPRSTAPDKRGFRRPPPTQYFDVSLSAHCHDKFMVNDFGDINVGVDVHDFYPRTLDELLVRSKSAPVFDSSIFLEV